MKPQYEPISWWAALPAAPWPRHVRETAYDRATHTSGPARSGGPRRSVGSVVSALRHGRAAAVVVVLTAVLAGPAAAQNEYANNGWYTGLEHADLVAPAQNEYRNSGWYTGLEHGDLPPVPSASDDGAITDSTALGLMASVAAVLLASAAVATTRARSRRVAM